MTTEGRPEEIAVPTYPDLKGKVAVVTGGSQGIGRSCCRMLARNGVKVAVASRSREPVEHTVEELRELGATAIAVPTDATSTSDIANLREQTESELGPADILLPFAGGFGSFTTSWETSAQEWRDVIESNLTSTHVAVSEFMPGMIARRHGSIVTMASISGRFLDKKVTASYAAAKAGVIMYTRHTAIEAGPFGVKLNSIAPGTVSSERIERIMEENALESTAALSPLGRLGTPEDCALATLFLVSDSSAWITGMTMDVNGGRVML
jgi:3-oxoacyl-[acyl-carrier protein] reductase